MMFSGRSLVVFGCLISLAFQQIQPASARCVCSVQSDGEYCGTQLNALDRNNQCPKKMYFCASSNRNKEAVLLIDCPVGRECDRRGPSGGNACLSNIECECPQGLTRGQVYCGSSLRGQHCSHNVTFRCPSNPRYHPIPLDACPNGCQSGQCVTNPIAP